MTGAGAASHLAAGTHSSSVLSHLQSHFTVVAWPGAGVSWLDLGWWLVVAVVLSQCAQLLLFAGEAVAGNAVSDKGTRVLCHRGRRVMWLDTAAAHTNGD